MNQVLGLLFETGLASAVDAALLALVVWGVTRVWRNAHVAHCLWLLVLVRLIVPTCWTVTIPVPGLKFVETRPQDPATVAASLVSDVGGDSLFSVPATDSQPQIGWDEAVDGAGVEREGPALASSIPSREKASSSGAWRAKACVVWISGSLIWTILVVCRMRAFRRLLRETRLAGGPLQQQAERFTAALGLRRCPEIRTTPGCISPLVWAVGRKPLILLPAELLEELDDCQRASLLAHEMAHIRRKDYWIRWLEFFVLGVYWWNPVAWWARRQLQAAEEECCDAWVVSLMGGESKGYAQALWKTIHWLSKRHQPLPQLASGMGRVGSITRRFEMIVGQKLRTDMTWCTRLTLTMAVLVVLPLSARVAVLADESTPPTEEVNSEKVTESSLEPIYGDLGLETKAVLADPGPSKAPGEDNLAERLGRLEKMVMELAQAIKSQRAATRESEEEDAGGRRRRSRSGAPASSGYGSGTGGYGVTEGGYGGGSSDGGYGGSANVSRFAAGVREQEQKAMLAAKWFKEMESALTSPEADSKNKSWQRARKAAEQQYHAVAQVLELQAKLAADAASALTPEKATPEHQLRQLEQQNQNLQNQVRTKELAIEQLLVELKFVRKQLEEVNSQVEKARKVAR